MDAAELNESVAPGCPGGALGPHRLDASMMASTAPRSLGTKEGQRSRAPGELRSPPSWEPPGTDFGIAPRILAVHALAVGL